MNSTHDCLAQHKVDLAGTLALGKGIFVSASIPFPPPPCDFTHSRVLYGCSLRFLSAGLSHISGTN